MFVEGCGPYTSVVRLHSSYVASVCSHHFVVLCTSQPNSLSTLKPTLLDRKRGRDTATLRANGLRTAIVLIKVIRTVSK